LQSFDRIEDPVPSLRTGHVAILSQLIGAPYIDFGKKG
jgi:hypothetical protein